MATIEDVAREAQVSVATVSRVINNSSVVKKETAERVHIAIKKLSYTPNLSARNLRRNESRVVLILAPNFTNPYYSQILSGICDTSRKLGYITLVYNTYDTLTLKEKALTQLIESYNVDGTIILAINNNDLWINNYKDKYPIVQCSEYVENSVIPHISVDNYSAAYEIANYLINLGHRRIGFIGSENKFSSTKMRFEGFKQALVDSNIELDSKLIAKGSVDYSFSSGKEAAEQLLSLPNKPTALFCVSDVIAIGAMAKARELGMSIPQDISITGFDDVDYTTMFPPYLTTIKVPCYDLGVEAMLLLRQFIQKKSVDEQNVFLPYNLVIRDSCIANNI